MPIRQSVPLKQSLAPYSETFNSWGKNVTTVTDGNVTGPRTGTTASTIYSTNNGSAVYSITDTTIALTTGKQYVARWVLKYDSQVWVFLGMNAATVGCWVNIQTGALGTQSGVTAKVSSASNGFYNVDVSWTQTTGSITMYLVTTNGGGTLNGTGAERVILQHVHVVDGPRVVMDDRGYAPTGASAINAGPIRPQVVPGARRFPIDTSPSASFSSNPILWLRADTGVVLDGSNGVISVADLSGSGNTFRQTTASKRPVQVTTGGLDGHPYFTLASASSQCLQSTGLVYPAGNLLYFFLYDATDVGGSEVLMDSFNGVTQQLVTHSSYLTAGKVAYYNGATNWVEPGDATTGPQLICFDLRTGAGKVYRNGVQIGSTGAYVQAALGAAVTIGGAYNGTGNLRGKLYEVLMLRSQTDGDVTRAHRYFAQAYPSLGITIP